MGLFKPDLYRNFAIGFVLGAILVGIHVGPEMKAEFATQAHAAESPASAIEAQ